MPGFGNRRNAPPCSICGAELKPLAVTMTTPAMICLVCDAPEPGLTTSQLGGMDTPTPGSS